MRRRQASPWPKGEPPTLLGGPTGVLVRVRARARLFRELVDLQVPTPWCAARSQVGVQLVNNGPCPVDVSSKLACINFKTSVCLKTGEPPTCWEGQLASWSAYERGLGCSANLLIFKYRLLGVQQDLKWVYSLSTTALALSMCPQRLRASTFKISVCFKNVCLKTPLE
ncbi:hypothetical protein BD626DRAFT_569454 [Schizophyllum amplum]|uniref:Uncharacterized protein n=1 Tax=Schizophyllum amplum TaxID=97359 RepID=A0A550CDL1_9AGAR|nr:hypothetical protein BD626DRAFT_569454 [Auriculariopsis ampla]